MPNSHLPKRLGFFTRLLEDASPGDRYRFAVEQIVHAEQNGFDSAWIAQHHFHANEGGLPSPLVLLSHVAALTSRIRLGTGVITLPLENPIRTAEDAAVLDLLSGGRLELGLATTWRTKPRSMKGTLRPSGRPCPVHPSSARFGNIPRHRTCSSASGKPRSRPLVAHAPARQATA